jgi:hypothetical protein
MQPVSLTFPILRIYYSEFRRRRCGKCPGATVRTVPRQTGEGVKDMLKTEYAQFFMRLLEE